MVPPRPPALLQHARRTWLRLVAGACLAAGSAGAFGQPRLPSATTPDWVQRLETELAALDGRSRPDLGVYVRDLGSGAAASHQADEAWYIASMVKLPVAIAVLRGVEAGLYTLETPLRLRAADYVDGAGPTNSHRVATPLAIGWLLEQMMVHSDNTASDMLIELVGLPELNALVASLVPEGFGRITTLAEVRRQVYGQLTDKARHLTGAELLRLHQQPTDEGRLAVLAQLTGVPATQFRRKTLASAYSAYYGSGLNSARLDAYGELLAQLAQGRLLAPASTAWLLALMERAQTGQQRLKAGLPAGVRLAHKTGTQRQRVCDAGLLQAPQPAGGPVRAVVVACVRGEASLPRAEALLREVGVAVCRSGLLNPQGDSHAPTCPPAPRPERGPVAAPAAVPGAAAAGGGLRG